MRTVPHRGADRRAAWSVWVVLALVAAAALVFGALLVVFTPWILSVVGPVGDETAEGGLASPLASPMREGVQGTLLGGTPQALPAPAPTHTAKPGRQPPTLADYWDGLAEFVMEVPDTGLPMGESDTIVMPNGEWWSYVHASQRSAGALDQCGAPVEFPGCVVVYRSQDGGLTFRHDEPPRCLFDCLKCPCDSEHDHIDQQQYPRVFREGGTYLLAYEYRAMTMLRRSHDGLVWSRPEQVPFTGVWSSAMASCVEAEKVRAHPFARPGYDCLAGGPPGLFLEDGWLYVFVAAGQSPGGLGCYVGAMDQPALRLRKCFYNPLFMSVTEYGPLEARGGQANTYFDFRTISSAEVHRVGARYYALYEGIRGPGPGDAGDTQFGLGLARSATMRIDGPWDKYPGNPILGDLPGNVGLGHADLVVVEGKSLLYTSLDGVTRSRLALVWK